MTSESTLLFSQWQAKRLLLERVRADEMDLRLRLADVICPELKEGTLTVPIFDGWKAKVTKEINYGFTDEKSLTSALSLLSLKEPDGAFVADRLVKYKPQLVVSEYRRLCTEHFTIVSPVIKQTASAPRIEAIEPKGTP